MKPIRPLSALLMTAMLAAAPCAALADKAPKEPSLKIEAPETPIPGGAMGELTVTASVPGFLTLTLFDKSGAEVMTLFNFEELHSNENRLQFSTLLDEGEVFAPGTYMFSATMTDQYGTVSSEATGSFIVAEKPVIKEPEENPEEEAKNSKDSKDSADEQDKKQEDTQDKKPDKKKPAEKKPAPKNEKPSYETISNEIGDEGYQIGVGVSDTVTQENAGYWALDASASDEEIWAAITKDLVGVNVGETESVYIYDSTKEGRKRIGSVSGISQGLNVIKERDDGWTLVEAFRNEDGAFVRGYIRSNKLRVAEPNTLYGMTIDKATQTLTVYQEGKRIGSCKVSTGLPANKYLHRETPAGEFITVTRRGTIEFYGQGYSQDAIRINGAYSLCEIPTTKKKGKDFSLLEDSLGEKATRGNICLPQAASSDGGINADWIWDMTDENKRVKVLIFDDKPRTDVPVGE